AKARVTAGAGAEALRSAVDCACAVTTPRQVAPPRRAAAAMRARLTGIHCRPNVLRRLLIEVILSFMLAGPPAFCSFFLIRLDGTAAIEDVTRALHLCKGRGVSERRPPDRSRVRTWRRQAGGQP